MPQFVSLLYTLMTLIVKLLYFIKNIFLVLFSLTETSEELYFLSFLNSTVPRTRG